MTLLLLDTISENPEAVGIFSAVALLLIRELRAIVATLALKKRETDIEYRLKKLEDLHTNPDSMFSTYGFRERLKEMDKKLEKILDKCQLH